MAQRVSRRMEFADRLILQQADQAIGKNVTRALVELITNSNDRYHILEGRGIPVNGTIVIEIQRRHSNSVIRVRDFATGMSSEDMDQKVGKYAEETSGFKQGESVRGLWGRGLKDSVYGLGHGTVRSICDDQFNDCSLLIKEGVPMYEREPMRKATRAIRTQFQLPSGNGSIVEIIISRDDVRTPLFDALRRNLEHHFEIRAILENSQRSVILREINSRGKVTQEPQLSYKPPIGSLILDEQFTVPGGSRDVRLEVYRSDEPLSTPGEEHEYADAGLLVMSRNIVLSLTLFKFDNNEHASRLYGRLTCDEVHELLKNDEPVLTATRDGINWKHPFMSELKKAVEARLQPLVEAEQRRALAEQRSGVNRKLREKLQTALQELNIIANLELGKGGEGVGNADATVKTLPFHQKDSALSLSLPTFRQVNRAA